MQQMEVEVEAERKEEMAAVNVHGHDECDKEDVEVVITTTTISDQNMLNIETGTDRCCSRAGAGFFSNLFFCWIEPTLALGGMSLLFTFSSLSMCHAHTFPLTYRYLPLTCTALE